MLNSYDSRTLNLILGLVIILPGSSIKEIKLAAERILDAVFLLDIEHKDSLLGKN